MMTKEEFRKQMNIAVALVNSWPLWKQNLLEQSSKPTVSKPRKPVINPRCCLCHYKEPPHAN